MAKKSRRNRKKSAGRVRPLKSVRVETSLAEEHTTPDFVEYRYVVTDLKRLAILATAMFALLIVLSFFIR
jgi:hypothetical protein